MFRLITFACNFMYSLTNIYSKRETDKDADRPSREFGGGSASFHFAALPSSSLIVSISKINECYYVGR